MSLNVIQPSLSAGEVSPSLFARVDLNQYKLGLATCRNMFVDYRSGVSSRPGTGFIARAKVSNSLVRLIPFQFSDSQTFMIEVGPQYFRFIQNGGQVLEPSFLVSSFTAGTPPTFGLPATMNLQNGDTVVFSGTGLLTATGMPVDGASWLVTGRTVNSIQITDLDGTAPNVSGSISGSPSVARIYTLLTPYLAADIQLLKYTQTANIMTFTHNNYPPLNLQRNGPANWSLAAISFVSPINPPASLTLATSGAGPPTATFAYVVTAVDAFGNESQPTNPATITGINISATQGTNTLTWTPVQTAAFYNIYKAELATSGSPPTGAAFGFIGTAGGNQAIDSNILPDFSVTPPLHRNPFAPGQIIRFQVLTAGSGGTASSTISISDPVGTGFVGVPLINAGGLGGVLIENNGQNYQSPVASFTGFTVNPTVKIILGPQTGTYPGCSDFYQQRQTFANTIDQPQTFWMSQPGDYANFDVSNPVTASDSISATIVSKQLNSIKHLIPMPGGLVVLTSQGAWQVSGGGGGINNPVPITPADAQAVPQAYIGSSDVQPLVVNYDILYVQSRGSVVRDLAYNLYFNIYAGTDISVFSNHMFFGHQIVQWTWAQEPYKLVWAIRDDGVLLSLTFLKEQQLQGWARHDTLGLFVSVASCVETVVLPSVDTTEQDSVYFVTLRQVQTSIGPQFLQYIERMEERIFFYGAEDAQCLDAAVSTVLPTPAATLSINIAGPIGTIATLTASASVFIPGNVGYIVRAQGGIFQITSYLSSTQVQAQILRVVPDGNCFQFSGLANGFTTSLWPNPLFWVDPNDPLQLQHPNAPLPSVAQTWSMAQQFTTFSGLSHLNGNIVMGLADGNVVGPFTVTNGQVTLPAPASKVILGLPFTCDVQTLRLDTGENAAQGGTIQGKRKRIDAVTLRLKETRGLQVGRTFGTTTPIKENQVTLGVPIPLTTGDERIVVDPLWDTNGQICIRQQWPLPVTILGIIPEIAIGDTAR